MERSALWWIESALLPRIDIASPPRVTGPEQSGTLVEPLTISILIDEAGWMWCTDAVVPRFTLLTAADRRVDVVLDIGAIQIPLHLGERVRTPGESAAWITAPPRGRRFQRILPVGSKVRLSGGELGDALRGTSASPLLASFGEAR